MRRRQEQLQQQEEGGEEKKNTDQTAPPNDSPHCSSSEFCRRIEMQAETKKSESTQCTGFTDQCLSM